MKGGPHKGVGNPQKEVLSNPLYVSGFAASLYMAWHFMLNFSEQFPGPLCGGSLRVLSSIEIKLG